MPREGIWNSMCTRSFCVVMLSMSPLRRVTMSIIFDAYSSVTFMVSSSTGSHFTPSISLMITWGCPT